MSVRFLLFFTLGLFLLVAPAMAEEKVDVLSIQQPSVGAENVLPVAPLVPTKPVVQIAPHKVTYAMSLGKAKAGSGIANVSGTMVFDWQDVCTGWATQQNMTLQFLYSEGDEARVSSPAVTWESKSGDEFTFHVRHMVGEQEDETYKGRVKRDDKGRAVAHYNQPLDKKDIEVEADTIFPSAHTLLLLSKAQAGEKMFSKRVFDGSDDRGEADISAFIGPRVEGLSDQALVPEARGNPLLMAEAWPVRMAFYRPDGKGSEPEYEMDILLQPNGVARSITIDYGDFTIQGTLKALEAQPSMDCNAEQKAP